MRPDFASDYGRFEQWHWWFRGRQRILEAVLARALDGRPPSAIASLGCGPWQGLRWLEPVAGPGGRIVGVDADRRHALDSRTSVTFVVGRAEALPFVARTFDVTLALDVLEHLDDDAAGLLEIARVTRPGGLLLVTVPALPLLWGRQDVVSQHRRRYTARSLHRVFERAGLPAPASTYFNSLLVAPIACVRLVRRWLGTADEGRSDFDDARPGVANDLLAWLFGAERHLVSRVRLPVGVSLLATLRMPAHAGEAPGDRRAGQVSASADRA